MTICHAMQEDEKELVFKFGFVGKLGVRVESLPLEGKVARPKGVTDE